MSNNNAFGLTIAGFKPMAARGSINWVRFKLKNLSLYLFIKLEIMEDLLIKVKNDEESSFIKDLLKKLHIQFETIHDGGTPSDEEKLQKR